MKVRTTATARRQAAALAAYRVDEAADTLWIVVVWNGMRGAGPDLP